MSATAAPTKAMKTNRLRIALSGSDSLRGGRGSSAKSRPRGLVDRPSADQDVLERLHLLQAAPGAQHDAGERILGDGDRKAGRVAQDDVEKIGRASCRERVCQYV